MLKKIQRRFILAAMAAFGVVMLVLIVGINGANYYRTTSMQDHQAEGLLEHERRVFEQPRTPPPPIKEIPGGGPEAEFTTRFFAVHCDRDGIIKAMSRDYISSVDDKAAREYTQAVLSKGKERGYYGDYRYLVREDASGVIVLFLNVAVPLQFMRSLLLVSLVIGCVSLFLVFVLVVLFSRRAIRPYVQNMERQKRFITDAGHELKTPITSIATSADISAMEHEGDEWIANIQKQTARLANLVGELVALSRLDEEMPFPEKSRFSLSEATWETTEPFAVLAKANGKTYSQKIEENLTLFGDRNSIQQMISILLDNAVRYSDKEGVIRLDIYRRRGRICVEVFNTCNLADISDLDRMFDRFYRMDESRSKLTGGTGIGLSMVKAIVEAHGGRVRVKSPDGKTICFRIVL